LKAEIAIKDAKIFELEKRLNQNSKNSHLPPSRDNSKTKTEKKNRRKKGGKVGGQDNHEGNTMVKYDEVDEILECPPEECTCGCKLDSVQGIVAETRQVLDIPPVSFTVTEYQRIDKQCPKCNQIVKGVFPQHVVASSQYGPNIQALAVGLNTEFKIPYAKVAELLEQLYGFRINTSTLYSINKRCSSLLEETEAKIKDYLFSQDLMHADETGLMVNTQTHWMHVLSNANATFLKVHKKRGSDSFENELYSFMGHLVHDFYSSYFKLENAKHNTCGCHIDRECEALIEDESNWALKMKSLLLELFHNEYEYNNSKKSAIYARYTRIINEGMREEPSPVRSGTRGREKRTKGLNLLLRLRDKRDEVLEFAFIPEIPFTNNQAERDLRHCKVKLKVSGCFRSLEGAQAYARIIAFISTLRKNSINIFEELTRLFSFEPLVLNLT
jgi:transposase